VTNFRAVICGGGVAGLEAALRLHRLAAGTVDVTLISPHEQLVYRPMAVLEPFDPGRMRRYFIGDVLDGTRTMWLRDSVAYVDRDHQRMQLSSGRVLPYDAVLLAPGGHRIRPPVGTFVFTDQSADRFRRLLAGLRTGEIGSVGFLAPSGPSWPLPLYELALLTAEHVRRHARQRSPLLAVCEADAAPLHAFGSDAGTVIGKLLDDAGVALHLQCGVLPSPRAVTTVTTADGQSLGFDRIVTIPRITGPNVRGIPGDAIDRFLTVDDRCHVLGCDSSVLAAGDATQLPVKHGGVAAQQADTAAAAIAHLAGIGEVPAPLYPVIRGVLATPGRPWYLTAHLVAGRGTRGTATSTAPWPVEDKILAAELGPRLAEVAAQGYRPRKPAEATS
jgi:sulfide:quinone oxidoreductase